MPVFNSALHLQRAIDSVVAQTMGDWEIQVIDDGSSDNSLELLKAAADVETRIHITQCEMNQGASAARNLGIEKAQGRYIAFLDADDEWFPKKLEIQIGWMRENKIAFSCTAYERHKLGAANKITHVPHQTSREQLLSNNIVGTLTAIYDSSILGKRYMEPLRSREDYSLWLELLAVTPFVYGLNTVLARYHQGHNSLSSNKCRVAKAHWSFLGQQKEMTLMRQMRYFASYAYYSALRNF